MGSGCMHYNTQCRLFRTLREVDYSDHTYPSRLALETGDQSLQIILIGFVDVLSEFVRDASTMCHSPTVVSLFRQRPPNRHCALGIIVRSISLIDRSLD